MKLDPAAGHEQQGLRPCIVVSDPEVNSDQRFPLVCVVPVTGTPGEGLLYPPLAPEEIVALDEGLTMFLGLGPQPHGSGIPPVQ